MTSYVATLQVILCFLLCTTFYSKTYCRPWKQIEALACLFSVIISHLLMTLFIMKRWRSFQQFGNSHFENWLSKHIFISFSSSNTQFYESRIFCLFTFWVFFPEKSFEFISKYTQKCQYNSLHEKEKKKTLCNSLNWGNWILGFIKLDVRWAERGINC